MQLPETRAGRLGATVLVVGVTFFVLMSYLLATRSPGTAATPYAAPGPSGSATPDAPGASRPAARPASLAEKAETQVRRDNVFDSTTASSSTQRYTLAVQSDGDPVRYQYLWRDGSDSREATTTSRASTGRTVEAASPAAAVWIQLGVDGGRATCRAIADGRTVTTRTITKPYAVAFCVA